MYYEQLTYLRTLYPEGGNMNPNMPSWYLSIIRQFSYAALPAIHTT